jgi:hypothetical protein
MAKAVRLKAKSVADRVDYPIADPDREKAWGKLIRSRQGKNLRDHGFPKDEHGFRFPMGGCYYELWCIAWEFAWDAGYRSRMEVESKSETKTRKKV